MLDRKQTGILFEVKQRAKIGNVRLDSKQLQRARELLAKNVTTNSWHIFRLLLDMDSIYAKAKYIPKEKDTYLAKCKRIGFDKAKVMREYNKIAGGYMR